MTHVVSHAFIHSQYEARMASCQLSGTFSYSQLRSHTPPLLGCVGKTDSRSRNRPDNESQVVLIPKYQSSLSLIGILSIAKISVAHILSCNTNFSFISSGICHETLSSSCLFEPFLHPVMHSFVLAKESDIFSWNVNAPT